MKGRSSSRSRRFRAASAFASRPTTASSRCAGRASRSRPRNASWSRCRCRRAGSRSAPRRARSRCSIPGTSGCTTRRPRRPRRRVGVARSSRSVGSPRQRAASEPATREQATRAAKTSFDRAWSLLRQGHAREAAALFAEVERDARDAGTREDALYWRAVATARTGDAAEAQSAVRRAVEAFSARVSQRPGGHRARLAVARQRRHERAARAFERAINDQSPAIRASAAEGLRRATAR